MTCANCVRASERKRQRYYAHRDRLAAEALVRYHARMKESRAARTARVFELSAELQTHVLACRYCKPGPVGSVVLCKRAQKMGMAVERLEAGR